jgi:hypothetical protein
MGYNVSASLRGYQLLFLQQNNLSPSLIIQDAIEALMSSQKRSLKEHIEHMEKNIRKLQDEIVRLNGSPS